ncbi:RNA-directed DNA polymerase, eukaryota [Tanacetum coccineum]
MSSTRVCFMQKYWSLVGADFCDAVDYFFKSGTFPRGCNSSFIALIPKVNDAKFVNDFRPISLIGCVYKVITKVLANRLATVISDLVSETQSAFVANRQILDGPFILNEVLNWCKRKRKQAMFFKVDFAKAYDSVRWDYLLDILHAFGFGPNWCRWIRGTFTSSMASILVNGSPTSEFPFCCGLKQGDPLAPYLFILIMESLHISFSRVVDDGLFKGFQLHGSVNISHLFYADDAMFIGEWSEQNLHNIVKVLNCFHLASGLKINIAKSQVLGVGVSQNVVVQAANRIGCAVLNTPFRYLGVTVGECMSRKSAWVGLVNKLQARLSKWKVKTLSIGGRLTLLKSVLGASPIYYMSIFKVPKGVLKTMESIRSKFFNGVDSSDRKISWVAWDNVLASKLNGGLGVSSFFALNRALLLKWVWRFISGDGSLWCKVIQAIYGSKFDLHVTDQPSIWCSILREVKSLKDSGFDFSSHCKKRIGDGSCTSFWYDIWLADAPLCVQFPRLFALELDKEIVVANKMGASSVSASFRRDVRDGAERQQWDDLSSIMNSVVLSSSKDRWTCDLSGDGEFKVKVIRNFIDDLFLPSSDVATRWVKFIPIKVNVFSWRARRDRLPTRVNLSRRGVLLDSHLCPLCNAAMEDVQHVFFRCDVARVVLRKICRWWDLDWQEICSFSDWDAWFLSFRLSSRLKSILEGVFYVAWWRIWRLRNQLVFDASPPNRSTIFDDIVRVSLVATVAEKVEAHKSFHKKDVSKPRVKTGKQAMAVFKESNSPALNFGSENSILAREFNPWKIKEMQKEEFHQNPKKTYKCGFPTSAYCKTNRSKDMMAHCSTGVRCAVGVECFERQKNSRSHGDKSLAWCSGVMTIQIVSVECVQDEELGWSEKEQLLEIGVLDLGMIEYGWSDRITVRACFVSAGCYTYYREYSDGHTSVRCEQDSNYGVDGGMGGVDTRQASSRHMVGVWSILLSLRQMADTYEQLMIRIVGVNVAMYWVGNGVRKGWAHNSLIDNGKISTHSRAMSTVGRTESIVDGVGDTWGCVSHYTYTVYGEIVREGVVTREMMVGVETLLRIGASGYGLIMSDFVK